MKKFVWIFMRSLYKIERIRLTQVKCLFEKAIQQHTFSVVFSSSFLHFLSQFNIYSISSVSSKYDNLQKNVFMMNLSVFFFEKSQLFLACHFSFLVRCRFSQCMQNRLPSISLTAKRRWHKNPVSWTMDRCVKQYKIAQTVGSPSEKMIENKRNRYWALKRQNISIMINDQNRVYIYKFFSFHCLIFSWYRLCPLSISISPRINV